MNFLQIQDEAFVDIESIKAIYRDGSVLKVDADSLEDYVVGEDFEKAVLTFAESKTEPIYRSTYGS